jgi:hypothetical protein
MDRLRLIQTKDENEPLGRGRVGFVPSLRRRSYTGKDPDDRCRFWSTTGSGRRDDDPAPPEARKTGAVVRIARRISAYGACLMRHHSVSYRAQ